MINEKQRAALSSVIAAVFLTAMKLIVGIFTGSLGILSEAAHSALDLGAAVITMFAVRISDKPADKEHNYGHGKIESFSALIETLLLLITCGWIMYEAIEKLMGRDVEVVGTFWGVLVMLIAISIDFSRSRVLKKAAEKYGSQALEADALHFSSDVLSSLVVIGGLICVAAGDFFSIPVLKFGDPIAALGVSVLVIIISIRLGSKTINALLDTAPKGMADEIFREVGCVQGVLDVRNVRIRPSGPNYFIDLNVGLNKNESYSVVHSIVDEIRERLQEKIPNSDIVIGTFPINEAGIEDKEVYDTVRKVVDCFPNCTNIHNIHIYEVSGRKDIAIHIEVKEIMSLSQSHVLSHEISGRVQQALKDVGEVSVNFEYVRQKYIYAQDITQESGQLISKIDSLVNKSRDNLNCHDIRIYRQQNKVTIFLHCELSGSYTIEKVQLISKNISEKIRKNMENIESVHIHVEPTDEMVS